MHTFINSKFSLWKPRMKKFHDWHKNQKPRHQIVDCVSWVELLFRDSSCRRLDLLGSSPHLLLLFELFSIIESDFEQHEMVELWCVISKRSTHCLVFRTFSYTRTFFGIVWTALVENALEEVKGNSILEWFAHKKKLFIISMTNDLLSYFA